MRKVANNYTNRPVVQAKQIMIDFHVHTFMQCQQDPSLTSRNRETARDLNTDHKFVTRQSIDWTMLHQNRDQTKQEQGRKRAYSNVMKCIIYNKKLLQLIC
jgi:hypothetical protein